MREVICIDASGVKGITTSRRYLLEASTDHNYFIYNDLQQTAGYAKERFSVESTEDRFREALERIANLTPGAANARTAMDLHHTVKAIAQSALDSHPAV